MPAGSPYITLDPNTGQTVAIYPDGSVVPVSQSAAPTGGTDGSQGQQGASRPVEQQEEPWFAGAVPEPAGSGWATGTDRPSVGGDESGGYANASGYEGFAGGLPNYANGRNWEDIIPTPGGEVAGTQFLAAGRYDGSDGGYPSGGFVRGIGQGARGGSGGGGGGASDLYYQLRGKLQGIAGNLMGGSSSSGYSSDYSSPRAPKERMRGEYARGLNATQAAGLSLRPTALLPHVFKGLSPADPLYNRLAALPAAQMSMLMGGYSGSSEDLANNLGNLYEGAARGNLPSTGKMIGQLGKSKGINEMFGGVKAKGGAMESYTSPGYAYGQEPLAMGEAAYTLSGLLDAALYNEPLRTQMKYGGSAPGSWGGYLIDKGSSKALGKKAGKGTNLNKYVSRRIFR